MDILKQVVGVVFLILTGNLRQNPYVFNKANAIQNSEWKKQKKKCRLNYSRVFGALAIEHQCAILVYRTLTKNIIWEVAFAQTIVPRANHHFVRFATKYGQYEGNSLNGTSKGLYLHILILGLFNFPNARVQHYIYCGRQLFEILKAKLQTIRMYRKGYRPRGSIL